jgi:hypothetical protein
MVERGGSARNREDVRVRHAGRLTEYRDEDFDQVSDEEDVVLCSGAPGGLRTGAARLA